MRAASFLYICLALGLAAAPLSAQTLPRPVRKGHKLRLKIDSMPQQAAIYVDKKEYGIEGYTPSTLRLPKGDYTIIVEAPGFKPVQRPVRVTRSEGFVFTLERQARPAVLDVRSTSSNEAMGAQLYVDGALMGTVPSKIEVSSGKHLVEIKKPGYKDYRESTETAEGEQRTLVVDMVAEQKKGSLLVTADVAGADVYVDGVRRDAAPALIGDLVEGEHTIEVRKDPAPPWKQAVRVIGNQQVKVEAKLAASQVGSIRVVSSTPAAEVLVDGEVKGPANSEITGLRPGQHIVEVRAKGHVPQVLEQTVVAGEQRIARIDLKTQEEKSQTTRLRVVTPVPDAEVFIDGSSVGKAPIDRTDLAPGKHYVVVRKTGFAEWKREINLDPAAPTTLTAELSASGTLKVLSNVAGADVLIDGSPVGKTPLTLENFAAGEHLVEVKKSGYIDAKQPFRLEGGEQKILSADLTHLRTGPSASDIHKTFRSMSSYSAVTIEPGKFTADIFGGFYPFGGVNLTVGAIRKGMFGLDGGVEGRTIGILTEGLAHAKFQFLKAGPIAMGTTLAIGGGGGPSGRNTFLFEWGIPLTLLFGELVRFTVHPYLQVYTDQNCPDKDGKDSCMDLNRMVKNPFNGRDQRVGDRFLGVRFMLRAALEIAVHQVATIFFIFEADPIAQRAAYNKVFSGFVFDDPQVYGRMGVSFKF